MSLLLDALKKAAEQKAEKSKEEAPRPLDDYSFESNEDGSAELNDDSNPANLKFDTDANAGESVLAGKQEELNSATDAATLGTQQMQAGEDQTIVFDDDDVADFLSAPQLINRDLDEANAAAESVAAEEPASPPLTDGEGSESDRMSDDAKSLPADTGPIQTASESDSEQKALPMQELASTEEEVLRLEPIPDDDTDRSPADNDLSLYLSEPTGSTAHTDPQTPEDKMAVLKADRETFRANNDPLPASSPLTSPTTAASAPTTSSATTRVRQETLSSITNSVTRQAETTGTLTYAPDNYDRTLMKLPNDDASKLFAGMKSDADVVMTPDYAKRVFRSKSSAQRIQHYKFYTGIAVVLLLGIGVYGLFEYQDESANIDTSLQPLKQDPLPGVIQLKSEAPTGDLFGEIDQRTLEIVNSVENSLLQGELSNDGQVDASTASHAGDEPAVEQAQAVETPVAEKAVAPTLGQSKETVDSATIGLNPIAPRADPAVEPETPANQTVAGATFESPSGIVDAATPSLQITRTSRVDEKERWLQQAYAAFQAGDDVQALEIYNRVLALEPGNRNALLARAAIRVQNDDAVAAIEDYQTLLQTNPKDSLALTSLITVANYSPRESESRLKVMIRDEPDSPYLNFALGNAYGAQDRWLEAQGHYFKALENNPNDPNYAYNLAVSLEHLSKPKVAIAYYQRALDNMSKGLATFSRDLVDQRLKILGRL